MRTYSEGMRRRLDLAASLVGRPQVLFLDEPTTGIDPRNRATLHPADVSTVEDLDRVPLRRAVSGTLVITRRNLLRNVRLPQLLLFATIQPVMFLLLLNFVFGGAIGGSLPQGFEYIQWLMATIGLVVRTPEAVQSAVFLPIFPLVLISLVRIAGITLVFSLLAVRQYRRVSD